MGTLPHALAFYEKGILPAMDKALRYAGKEGQLATLPELVTARLEGAEGARGQWYTTSSSLYFGRSMAGNPIIIVAHGTGPLMGRHIREESYTARAEVRNNSDYLGTVARSTFLALASGEYGNVAVIDAAPYMGSRSNGQEGYLMDDVHFGESFIRDPLAQALLGSNCEKYMLAILKENQKVSGPHSKHPLVSFQSSFRFTPDLHFANFLALEGTEGGIGLQDGKAMAMLVAVRDKGKIKKIHRHIDMTLVLDQMRGLQREFDRFRNQVEILAALHENNLL